MAKSRFQHITMKELIDGRNRGAYGFNKHSHNINHKPTMTTYTSKAALGTDASTPFYLPFSARLLEVRANVTAAPTSTMKIDVLFDGNSVFDGTNYLEIPSGDLLGKGAPGRTSNVIGQEQGSTSTPTKIQVQINTVAAATGPMVVYFFWEMEA